MIVSLPALLKRTLFAVLLVAFTLIVFASLRMLSDWIRMPDPFAVPHGHAVKVFEPLSEQRGQTTFRERLGYFYTHGE